MKLEQLHRIIADRLAGIADALPETYKLTLVARYTGTEYADADIVVTDDEMPLAQAAIQRRIEADSEQVIEAHVNADEMMSPDLAKAMHEMMKCVKEGVENGSIPMPSPAPNAVDPGEGFDGPPKCPTCGAPGKSGYLCRKCKEGTPRRITAQAEQGGAV